MIITMYLVTNCTLFLNTYVSYHLGVNHIHYFAKKIISLFMETIQHTFSYLKHNYKGQTYTKQVPVEHGVGPIIISECFVPN